MKVTRLLVLTPRELTHDVRARRQVLAARARDVDVVGLCVQLEAEEPAELAGVMIDRVTGDRLSSRLRSAGLGGMRTSRPIVRELRGLYRLVRLARTSLRLASAGRKHERFDIVHANDFDALPAAWWLARRWDARLVYDAHELYSESEPDPPRLYRAAALAAEGFLSRRAHVVMTNCPLFADFLHRRLHLRQPPVIVLNCPDLIPAKRPQADAGRLRVVYQAAVDHAGRPVGDVLEAAALAPDADFTIRLVQVDRAHVVSEIERRGLADRVRLEPPVPVEDLVAAMQGFDVGLVINRPVTPNEELALPGKIFEYMMAGLAVASSRLSGVLPVVEEERVGVTYAPGRPEELAAALQGLARDRAQLAELQTRARRLAVERYNSDAQAEVLAAAWSLTSVGTRATTAAAQS